MPALCEQLSEPILLLRTDGVVQDANGSALAFAGAEREAVIGHPLAEAPALRADAATQQALREMVAAAAAGGTDRRRLVGHADRAAPVMLELQLQPVRGDDGRVRLLLAAGRDVTAQDRIEQALRANEAELEQAQRVAHVGSWRWDVAADRVVWSDELHRIFGRVPGSPPPSYAEHPTLYTPESWARLDRAVQCALRDGSPYRLELEFVRPDGTHGWLESRGEAECDAAGRVATLRGTAQDISERRAMQQAMARDLEQARALAAELQERSQREREMLQFLAHEVRQPLHNASAALQSASAALQTAGERGSEVGSRLVRADEVLGHVIGALNNTLAAATLLITGGRQTLSDTDLEVLVSMVLHDVPAEQRSRVVVDWRCAARTVRLQPNLTRLALFNLLSNALDYSPKPQPVKLTIADSEDPLAIVVEVLDHGPGIPPALLARLGERGVRGSNAANRPGGGLGLHIVRQVMALHRGRLMIEPGTGGGTLMRLIFPQDVDL